MARCPGKRRHGEKGHPPMPRGRDSCSVHSHMLLRHAGSGELSIGLEQLDTIAKLEPNHPPHIPDLGWCPRKSPCRVRRTARHPPRAALRMPPALGRAACDARHSPIRRPLPRRIPPLALLTKPAPRSMRQRDVVSHNVFQVGTTEGYLSNHWATKLENNPTNVTLHILADGCSAPVDLRNILHVQLVDGHNLAAALADRSASINRYCEI